MVDADILLREGDVDGARAALIARAKASPADAATRMFLFQLFAVTGEWDKARAQLDMLVRLSPGAQMLAVAYGQAITAERQRAAALAGAAPVPVLARAGGWIDDLAAALGRRDEGDAETLRDRALDAAPDMPGVIEADGMAPVSFDWIADADAWFGPAVEAIIAGTWGLLPFDAVEWIKSAGARDLRDTIWYPVEIGLTGGRAVAALLPARYPGSETACEARLRLAGATDWTASGHGVGQHLLATSAGTEVGLMAIRRISFATRA